MFFLLIEAGILPEPAVVDFALRIGVSKVITLLEEAILIDGAPAHAIRAAGAEALAVAAGPSSAALFRACHDRGHTRTAPDAGEASPAGAARSKPELKTSVVRKTVMNGSLFTGCCEGSIYGG